MVEQLHIHTDHKADALSGRHRIIKSFVLRTGRMTAAQKKGWDEKWPIWGLQRNHTPQVLAEIFERKAPIVLEIGFGMGHSLIEMAQKEPDKNFIGVEVHKPGVGCLLHNVNKAGLKNIRAFYDDAVDVLNDCIPAHSLHRIQIYFPDPWHKNKHSKRRLIKPNFISLLHSRLKQGGILHLATDWQPYAQEMLRLLSSAENWKNQAGEKQFSSRSENRPLTKFERRGQTLGHGVWDLLFETY